MIKQLGLFATLILIVGLAFVVYKWPFGLNRTFSQHIARHKSAIIYYFLLFAIVLTLLLIFFLRWFIPHLGLTKWFTALIILASAFQLACTIVPETGGSKSYAHRAFAFLSADLLLPAVVLLVFSNSVNLFGKIVSSIAALSMLVIIVTMLKNKAEHKYLLLLQAAYFFCFFTAIISITYTVK